MYIYIYMCVYIYIYMYMYIYVCIWVYMILLPPSSLLFGISVDVGFVYFEWYYVCTHTCQIANACLHTEVVYVRTDVSRHMYISNDEYTYAHAYMCVHVHICTHTWSSYEISLGTCMLRMMIICIHMHICVYTCISAHTGRLCMNRHLWARECFESWLYKEEIRRENDTLPHTATHRHTLQHTATHCNTMRHTHCNTRICILGTCIFRIMMMYVHSHTCVYTRSYMYTRI